MLRYKPRVNCGFKDNPYVRNFPTSVGRSGLQGVREFYINHFICCLLPDTETRLISRTIGNTQIVDEFMFKFTHALKMDCILPGIEPTGRRVEVCLIAIVGF